MDHDLGGSRGKVKDIQRDRYSTLHETHGVARPRGYLGSNLPPMRTALLLLLACSIHLANAQPPNTGWLRTAGGFSQYVPYRSVADPAGRIYTCGTGSALDYGSGITVADQGFSIARYTREGDILWARTLATVPFQDEVVNAIATNSASDLWVVGSFTSASLTVDAFTLTNAGLSSAFMVRFDSTGVAQFATSWGGSVLESVSALDVCVGGNDKVFVSGSSNAVSLAIGGVILLNTTGGDQLTTLKFDAAGVAQWGKISSAATAGGSGLCIAVDKLANVYVTGRFDDTLIIDDDTLSTLITDHVALIKFTSVGDVAWLHALANCDPLDLAVDADGNAYVCGDFQYLADFDGDTLIPSVLDGFVSAYTTNGVHRWVTGVQGDIDNELCWSVAVDSAGTKLVVAGTFVFSAWFGDQFVSTGTSPTDGFVMRMDTSGEVHWVKDMTGDGPTMFAQTCLDHEGQLYASGVVQSLTTYLDEPVVNGSGNHAFLARFDELSTGFDAAIDEASFQLFPNPSSGVFTMRVPSDARSVIINDALGCVKRTVAIGGSNEMTLHIEVPGVFFVEVITTTGRSVQKIIVD